jgi:hypothetical protein
MKAGGKHSFFFDPEKVTICSSETSDDFQRTTWNYIPEDSTLYNHRYENLKTDNSNSNQLSFGELIFLQVFQYSVLHLDNNFKLTL